MKPEDWLRIVYEEMGETVPEGADYRKYIFKKRREAADYWIPRPFSVTHPS